MKIHGSFSQEVYILDGKQIYPPVFVMTYYVDTQTAVGYIIDEGKPPGDTREGFRSGTIFTLRLGCSFPLSNGKAF